jgi:hypothetical protein
MLIEVVVACLKTLSQHLSEWRGGPTLGRNYDIQFYTFVCVCGLGFEMQAKDYFKEMSLDDIYLKFTESGWAYADGGLFPKISQMLCSTVRSAPPYKVLRYGELQSVNQQ